MQIKRLAPTDRDRARALFEVMARVFGEARRPLGDRYLDRLLRRSSFWALVALHEGEVVGGLTAHALPMTTSEVSELLIYDLAVREDHQRKGIGRQLLAALRTAAAEQGIGMLYVPVDDGDAHALEFYRAVGGEATPVTFFLFHQAGA
ncbi:MAG TPA: GNAT family N-acetyltransferase [Geothrix sp.]|nr:GNAT family N-acetyltransferase [Geothrix sp.]